MTMHRPALAATLVLAGLSCASAVSDPGGGSCREGGSPLPASSMTVTLDVDRRFQTIQGFGTTERLFDDPHVTETFNPATQRAAVVVPPAEQAKIFDALYVDLGLTRVRWNPRDPGGGLEPLNDNGNPDVTDLSKFDFSWKNNDGHIDYVKAVLPRGVTTYFASPLTLEPWMTESSPAEYVEWAMAILRRWRDRGVEMPYYSVLNEPGNPPIGPWSGIFLRDVIKLLGATLETEGFRTKIVAPDDLNPTEAFSRLQVILSDPGARRHVGAIAYHLYGMSDRERVKQLSEQYGIPVWMTEFYHSDWLAWATIMHEMLGTYDAAAVDYLWGYFGQWDGSGADLVTINYSGTTYTGFRRNKQYFVTGQYSRFVRPGARRVQAIASDPSLAVTAWIKGDELVFVLINQAHTDQAVRFELGATAPCVSSVQPVTTGAVDEWRSLSPIALDAPRFVATLPARSVTTLIAR